VGIEKLEELFEDCRWPRHGRRAAVRFRVLFGKPHKKQEHEHVHEHQHEPSLAPPPVLPPPSPPPPKTAEPVEAPLSWHDDLD
jgi:hypothetical protein